MERFGDEVLDLGNYVGTYVGNNLLGFEKGKTYNIEIDKKPNQPYDIYEQSGLYMVLSSEISINQYFKNLQKA